MWELDVTVVICEGEQSIYLTEVWRLHDKEAKIQTKWMASAATDELDGDKLVDVAIQRFTRTHTEIKCTLGHKSNIPN